MSAIASYKFSLNDSNAMVDIEILGYYSVFYSLKYVFKKWIKQK